MPEIVLRSQFKKDYKIMEKRSLNMDAIDGIMYELSAQRPLPKKNCDHILLGEYAGYRECHVAPDWLLIYKIIKSSGNRYFLREPAAIQTCFSFIPSPFPSDTHS